MKKDQQAQRGRSQRADKAPKKQLSQEKHADPAYRSVLAALDSASAAHLGQLSGDALLKAAGSLGNQALLAAASQQTDDAKGLRETAAILDGATVPPFKEDAPLNELIPQDAFPPAPVPDFGFPGGQPVSFQAVSDIALSLIG